MEGYHRDSLRELRRMELDMERQEKRRNKGSAFITLLIILLFLGAGLFYIKTEQPAWLEEHFNFKAMGETLTGWKDELVAVFKSEDAAGVQATVDQALAEQNEAA